MSRTMIYFLSQTRIPDNCDMPEVQHGASRKLFERNDTAAIAVLNLVRFQMPRHTSAGSFPITREGEEENLGRSFPSDKDVPCLYVLTVVASKKGGSAAALQQ